MKDFYVLNQIFKTFDFLYNLLKLDTLVLFKLIVLDTKKTFLRAHFVAMFICSGCHNFGFFPNLVIERRIIGFSISIFLKFYPSDGEKRLKAYNT